MIMITTILIMTTIALALVVVNIVITLFLEGEDMEVVEDPDLVVAVEEEDIAFQTPQLFGQKMRQVLMQQQIKSW